MSLLCTGCFEAILDWVRCGEAPVWAFSMELTPVDSVSIRASRQLNIQRINSSFNNSIRSLIQLSFNSIFSWFSRELDVIDGWDTCELDVALNWTWHWNAHEIIHNWSCFGIDPELLTKRIRCQIRSRCRMGFSPFRHSVEKGCHQHILTESSQSD